MLKDCRVQLFVYQVGVLVDVLSMALFVYARHRGVRRDPLCGGRRIIFTTCVLGGVVVDDHRCKQRIRLLFGLQIGSRSMSRHATARMTSCGAPFSLKYYRITLQNMCHHSLADCFLM